MTALVKLHLKKSTLNDSVSKTSFEKVDEMVSRLYYLYKSLQKMFRPVKESVDLCSKLMEFSKGSY